MDEPLVSCLMPTADRRRFVPLALRQFLAQDWPNKELIIVDDGNDGVADLVPEHPQLRYRRLPRRASVGAKRNLCAEAARGELLMHWDDDDWMAPHRIRSQVGDLLAHGAELGGADRLLFLDLADGRPWEYRHPAGSRRRWVAGGTFVYRRSAWLRQRFADTSNGEDTRFAWALEGRRIAVHPQPDFYVATIHANNTCPRTRLGRAWQPWPGDLRSLMGGALADYLDPTPRGEPRMKLNLGCCDAPQPGHVNVDHVGGPGVDVVADLRQPWPWPDGSASHIRAWDIVEHLPDKIHTMNELWRCLAPGGSAEIVVPTTDGSGAFQDPTHVSFWNRRSFLYYEAGNPYRERFAHSYGIRAKFRTVAEKTETSLDGPRLTITLQAVKP